MADFVHRLLAFSATTEVIVYLFLSGTVFLFCFVLLLKILFGLGLLNLTEVILGLDFFLFIFLLHTLTPVSWGIW